MEPLIQPSTHDDSVAMENGRLYAAWCIAEHPEQRKRVEEQFGVDFCRIRWPEAYRPEPFFKRAFAAIIRRLTSPCEWC